MNRIRTHAFIALGWIALLFGSIAAADAKPFDRMIGCWEGKAEMYNSNGAPGPQATSSGSVIWKTPNTVMTFKETTNTPQGPITLENDFDVVGKVATFHSADRDVTGTEMNSSTYEFVLNFKTGSNLGTWYNVHYFTGPGRRLVIGAHEIAGSPSQVDFMALQHLKRVACHRTP